ncbi:hypothetical protein [Kitasatospora sp. NPDC017646]|uniref:hypothetical protein n=1 Tax=Kitasatospora sp. NPDC017646 TaxID=3364024 RepID=UPI0037B6CB04
MSCRSSGCSTSPGTTPPPRTARAALQGHIARLRALLTDGPRLETRAPGYALRADPDMIDAHRLERLLDRARAEPVDGAAVPLLREAVALRRGPALADCGSTALRESGPARLHRRHRRRAAPETTGTILRRPGPLTVPGAHLTGEPSPTPILVRAGAIEVRVRGTERGQPGGLRVDRLR